MGSLARDENLERLRDGGTWDVVVIGGGATGLGSAVDAAARGYRTLLLEALDFAQGTSSRSTKLIHGGVRYLAQGNIALVREALARARAPASSNAPHLVHRRDFVVPAYRWLDLPFYGIGLKVYDLLAGSLQPGRLALDRPAAGRPSGSRRSSPTGLRGGIVYTDGQFDDARLAIALARTFADLGGTALNYAPVVGFITAGRADRRGRRARRRDRRGVDDRGARRDQRDRRLRRRGPPARRPATAAVAAADAQPGDAPRPRSLVPPGRDRTARPAHRRRPRPLHDPLARPGPGRNDRHAGPRAVRRAAAAAQRRSRICWSMSPGTSSRNRVPTTSGARSPACGRCSAATRPRGRHRCADREALARARRRRQPIGAGHDHRREMDDLPADGDRRRRPGDRGRRPHPATSRRPRRSASTAGKTSPTAAMTRCRSTGPMPPGSGPWPPRIPNGSGRCTPRSLSAGGSRLGRAARGGPLRRGRAGALHSALFLDARASIEAAPVVAALLAVELAKDTAWQDAQVAQFRDLATGYLPP